MSSHSCFTRISPHLQALHFVIPPIATTAAETFAVSEFDNGDGTFDRFMSADMSIEASGPRYEFLILYARLMVVVWIIGVPFALYTLLWTHRGAIEERHSRKGPKSLATLRHLFRYGR